MTVLAHERYCDEIVGQADVLCALLDGAGPGALERRVPSCPDWDAGQLVRHVGETLRWIGHIARERLQEDPPREDVPDADGPEDPRELTGWLAESARLVSGALREAGPDTEVWSWAWESTTGFWARRMCHEVVVHRADAVLALQGPDAAGRADAVHVAGADIAEAALGAYRVDPVIAADALDEWLQIMEFSTTVYGGPKPPPGVGGTLHLHATDVPGAEWLIEVDGQIIRWRRAHEKADVAVRAPLAALLLSAVRRLPLDGPPFEVFGDRPLLDHWVDVARFD